jgi:hypothetical protein
MPGLDPSIPNRWVVGSSLDLRACFRGWRRRWSRRTGLPDQHGVKTFLSAHAPKAPGRRDQGRLQRPLGRVAHKGEQALAGFLEAGRDRPAAELPLDQGARPGPRWRSWHTCRSASGRGVGVADVGVAATAGVSDAGGTRAAIALSRRLRSPSGMASFSRSPSVSSGRMSKSIAASENASARWPSPCSASQRATSSIAPLKPSLRPYVRPLS